jgi:aminoglycoside phosphotransferase (APT) family kinase protein
MDPNCPALAPEQRARVYERLAATLATLHSLDPAGLGLGDFGNPSNYCRRQVGPWGGVEPVGQGAAAGTTTLHGVMVLRAGLLTARPLRTAHTTRATCPG